MPRRFVPRADDVRRMLRLALPVVLVQVGMMAMGVVDTVMVGHLSGRDLAAVALGNVYFFAIAIFGSGVLMALDPLVAQAVGAGDEVGVARSLQRGLVLAALLSLPTMLALMPAAWLLAAARQPAEVVPVAAGYARACAPGVVPFFAFVVLRQTLQARHRLGPIVFTIVMANLVNVFGNWALIYGEFGAPALGAVGSAWATTGSRWLMALALLALGWRELRPYLLPLRRDALELRPLGRMLALGAPIGAQQQLEYGAFGVVGFLMGWLGTREVAGHQIALNLASVTFMVPLGVSAAAAVLVGRAIGEGDAPGARRAAGAALICGTAFMSASALVFLGVPGLLAGLYTEDRSVITIAAALIPIAGLFQLFDGWQVVSIGVLRGAGDTRAPMVVNLLGFWVVGMPVSAWLGLRSGWGPAGLWWGLVIGLAAVSLFLLARVRWRLGAELRRVLVDDHPALTPAPEGEHAG